MADSERLVAALLHSDNDPNVGRSQRPGRSIPISAIISRKPHFIAFAQLVLRRSRLIAYIQAFTCFLQCRAQLGCVARMRKDV